MAEQKHYWLQNHEFKRIRMSAGFYRADMARVISSKNWSRCIRTVEGIKSLEERPGLVPDRYLRCLIELVGKDAFAKWYEEIERQRPAPAAGVRTKGSEEDQVG
jgi:hypothetical protein